MYATSIKVNMATKLPLSNFILYPIFNSLCLDFPVFILVAIEKFYNTTRISVHCKMRSITESDQKLCF